MTPISSSTKKPGDTVRETLFAKLRKTETHRETLSMALLSSGAPWLLLFTFSFLQASVLDDLNEVVISSIGWHGLFSRLLIFHWCSLTFKDQLTEDCSRASTRKFCPKRGPRKSHEKATKKPRKRPKHCFSRQKRATKKPRKSQ